MIGLVMATELEAAPFIREIPLVMGESDPFRVYGNRRFRLIISGIGKANAAMASAYLIRAFQPEFVVNLGASGATGIGPELGQCYHITKVIEPDRPDLRTDVPHEHVPDILAGFPVATLATQDRPVRRAAERRKLAARAELVDMEGASVVQACAAFHVKCFLFKFVSDTPKQSDVVRNIQEHRDAFYRFFARSALPELLGAVREG